MPGKLKYTVAALLFLLLPSCVYSVHPLSDDTNSFLDEDLIGYWKQHGSSPTDRCLIGRKPETDYTLVWVDFPRLTDERYVKEAESMSMYIRKGKTGNYLSIESNSKQKGKKFFVICKYDMLDRNRFRWFLPNEDFFEDAVERGELKGDSAGLKDSVIKLNDPGVVETQKRGVFLSDTPDRLFNFLEKHGAKCFEQKPAVFLRFPPTK